jgi:hypothetical protein
MDKPFRVVILPKEKITGKGYIHPNGIIYPINNAAVSAR